ncbi:beta strand repeat-containing protein [Planotetraspora silvatica]|uniref:beta strand repeat-containing protein n=4 Tax=Planotetraspora silvatica TaxID=234614 RepID=UPI0031D63FF2
MTTDLPVVISCGPDQQGPTLRLTREMQPGDDRAIVTVLVANTSGVDAKQASFSENLSAVPGNGVVGTVQTTSGTLTYDKPLLKWTGDLAAGDSVTIRYAVPTPAEQVSIPTVDASAGQTCETTTSRSEAETGQAETTRADATADPAPATPGDTADPAPVAPGDTAARRGSSKRIPTEADAARSRAKAGARVALRSPIAFSQRYLDNYRGAVTRAGNAVVTCYPPAVADCPTRRNGSGNNSVAATFIDVDSDASTFNSSTADLAMSPGAQVAYARLYWGGRSQTTTDTPGLPSGNRFAPNNSLRGQVLIKAPGSTAYQTITASAADIGDTPDNVTATGIVYGASADVTSLVASAGAGTYSVANLQAARGFDGLGAFGGWSLVVAYRDASLPLRNISVYDGFLEQENGAPNTTINLSGFQTPVTGTPNVQLGQIAYDGDNAIVGDSLSIKTTNGPLTVLSDAIHPANNFFNSTIGTLGNQVLTRNPAFTNTLGYDSNIVNASSAFRNNDTSAQVTFSTVGDAYWPHAFFTQIDLHQANIQMTKSAQVIGGGVPAPGSVVEYTITATNVGDDNAIGVVLSDPIPANTIYVPETISVASGPNTGPKTDAVGDDQGEFVANRVDVQLGTGAGPFNGGTLAVGQSTSVKFRVTLGPDSPGTTVTDTATVVYASADTPTQQGASSGTTATVVPAQVSSLALLKTAFPSTVLSAGRTVTYSFLVTNTGQTTLTGISATDTSFSGTGTPPVITCPMTPLAPQASTTCTGTYVVTQADVDAGSVVNTATASGTPPSGPAVTSNDSTATVTITAVSSLALLKTASPSTVLSAGRTVTYSYLVTNTGRTTLTNISATDTAFSGTGTPPVITCPMTPLAPQASTTCTGTYVVTQADVDAGSVVNTATASGTPPTGPAVTSNDSTATVTITAVPGLALLKTASPSAVTVAGQTITYSYMVTNTGRTTLTGISATDTAFSGTGTPPVITCPMTPLAPQASTTCTGDYTVTQADIDAGSIVNTATASGTPPTGPAITSDPSTATVTGEPAPGLALLKTAAPSTVGNAGRTVTYSYFVINTGNETLTDISATDTAFSGSGTPPLITCPVTTLAPQESTTCTGMYTITQADADAGSVVNTATASGTTLTGLTVTSASSTATVTIAAAGGLALLKTAAPSFVGNAGRTVTYSYFIINNGNVTLTNVTATDTAFSGTGTPAVITCPMGTLAPQASTTCTGTYTITQADADAGSVVNTATASGTQPSGAVTTSNDSTATVTIAAASGLALLKTAAPSTVGNAGRTVTYSFRVINTGNVTLANVTATDTAFSGTGTPPVITCPMGTLAPQASTTCTGTYTITQADIDAGSVVNTATATATQPSGAVTTSNDSTATVTAEAASGLALLKTASPSTVGTAGETVTYSYFVLNTGNVTLTNVTAADTAFSGTGTPAVITCPMGTLAPQASTTCTGTYMVTQADIDAGSIVNTATATATQPSGAVTTSDPSTATVTADAISSLALLKTATPTRVTEAGQAVTYSYMATNTGNVTLTNVTATDTAFSGTGTPPVITCPMTALAPLASTTCTGMYFVTQADIDAGSIVNTATATATQPSGAVTTSDPSTATVTADVISSLALQKSATPTTVTSAGETITYSYMATNTGNVTLTNVSATDTAFSGTGTPAVITCLVTTLAPQDSTTCTGDYTVTQADIDAGSIVNTATASGTPPTGTAITSNASTATVTAAADSSLTLAKTAAPNTVASAGQTVTYFYVVTNTGNVTLDNVSAADLSFSGSGTPPVITCPATSLAPQASTTCTGDYTVTQADIDAGSIVNTATASGTQPSGAVTESNASTATVTATADSALTLAKTAAPDTVTSAGQTVTYSHAVTNTGNVTLTSVHVTEMSFSGSGTPPVITCGVTTLAPQESTMCTGDYTVIQADIDAGSIVNTATASGTPPTGTAITSNASTATVTATADPSLTLTKTAAPDTVTSAGQIVTYSYAIMNAGNVTLTNVTATDTAFSGTGTPPVIMCPMTALAPLASTTCTGDYTVTQADIDAGSIVNTATASATPPTGTAITSNASTATVTAEPAAGLALLKTASPSTVGTAGRTITYSYAIRNTGNVTLTGVTATDTAFSGTGTPPAVSCPMTTLAPQASTMCTGTYAVTQADVDAGSIVNTARASGTLPSGAVTTSTASTATVTATADPSLTLVKTATPRRVTSAGQRITYSYAIANTGDVTLTDVTATDTAFSGTGTRPVITCPMTTLPPRTSTTCTGSYTVTRADIAADSIVNTATASGRRTSGAVTTSTASTATVTVYRGLPLIPEYVCPQDKPRLRDVVLYTIRIRNTGSSKLTEVKITNDLSGVLDDGVYRGGVKASKGSVEITSATLTWEGTLKAHRTAVITYPIRLNRAGGDHHLINSVITPALSPDVKVSGRPGADSGHHRCHGVKSVLHPHLTSFDLGGQRDWVRTAVMEAKSRKWSALRS